MYIIKLEAWRSAHTRGQGRNPFEFGIYQTLRGTFSVKTGKGDLGTEPPCTELCRVALPPGGEGGGIKGSSLCNHSPHVDSFINLLHGLVLGICHLVCAGLKGSSLIMYVRAVLHRSTSCLYLVINNYSTTSNKHEWNGTWYNGS